MKSFTSQQSGFSLVETLVATSLLLIVIVGPMTISTSTARSTSFASEQVIAFFLAQEGAELAQKARDDRILPNFLETTDGNYVADPWDDFTDESGFFDDCFASNGCGLELNTDAEGTFKAPIACSGSACDLYLNPALGRSQYTHSAINASTTPFSRRITFENISADEVRVVSRVVWRSGNLRQVQSVQVETSLFNVYDN